MMEQISRLLLERSQEGKDALDLRRSDVRLKP